jgi:hypothetical protein
MNKLLFVYTLIVGIAIFPCDALVGSTTTTNSRRDMLNTIPKIAFITGGTLFGSSIVVEKSYALDMDAFINKELANDNAKSSSNKKLTNDEALCKYGQPSKDRGDACVRAGLPISLPGRAVNAYGEVDRGTFVRCKQFYELEEEGYVKKTYCE